MTLQKELVDCPSLLEDDDKTWYSKYGKVMLGLLDPLALCPRPECVIAIARFVEGVSWGYSSQLQHSEL